MVGASILVVGTEIGTQADSTGGYVLDGIPCGEWSIRFSHVGFSAETTPGIVIADGSAQTIDAGLDVQTQPVGDITVSADRWVTLDTAVVVRHTMNRRDLETAPQLAEDLFRAAARLPGVAANDFSERFSVRGGEYEEVLVLLDGFPLREPFHVKEIDGGLVSIVDIAAVDSVELMPGVVPAQYGNCLSGVFEIRSREPLKAGVRHTVALSLLNLRAMSEGAFAGGRGSWLVSGRRGYAEQVTPLALDSIYELRPVYWDVYGRVRFALSDRHELTVSGLYVDDGFAWEEHQVEDVGSHNSGAYLWLTHRLKPGGSWVLETVAGGARLADNRDGHLRHGDQHAYVFDTTRFSSFSVSQSLAWTVSETFTIELGHETERQSVHINYWHHTRPKPYPDYDGRPIYPYANIDSSLALWQLGAYTAFRIRPLTQLGIDIGLRWDRCPELDETHTSPRWSTVYEPLKGTVLRAGSGWFYQQPSLGNTRPLDRYGYRLVTSAERVRQWTIGLDQTLPGGMILGVEAYNKKYTNLRSAYRSASNTHMPFTETYGDMIRFELTQRRVRGVSIRVTNLRNERLRWRLGYALAHAEEDVRSGLYRGEYYATYALLDVAAPAPYDRRHSVTAELDCIPARHWQMTAAWTYHSGDPHTALEVIHDTIFYRPGLWRVQDRAVWMLPNSSRFPAYHRLDLRVTRSFATGWGDFSVFFEVINVYNRQNPRLVTYRWTERDDDTIDMKTETYYWLPRLPSIGVRWTWGG